MRLGSSIVGFNFRPNFKAFDVVPYGSSTRSSGLNQVEWNRRPTAFTCFLNNIRGQIILSFSLLLPGLLSHSTRSGIVNWIQLVHPATTAPWNRSKLAFFFLKLSIMFLPINIVQFYSFSFTILCTYYSRYLIT